jgi:hypothetical protein
MSEDVAQTGRDWKCASSLLRVGGTG